MICISYYTPLNPIKNNHNAKKCLKPGWNFLNRSAKLHRVASIWGANSLKYWTASVLGPLPQGATRLPHPFVKWLLAQNLQELSNKDNEIMANR